MIPNFVYGRFLLSCVITGIALFLVGSLRIFIEKKRWFLGGIEMLMIGGAVAAIAYGVGFIIKELAFP